MPRKHAHYFRNVAHLSELDVYRVLDLFGVTDQALGHAIKKLLAPGGRGAGKDFRRDVQEAVDTLTRRLEMLGEDAAAAIPPPLGCDIGGRWVGWVGSGTPPTAPDLVVEVLLEDGETILGKGSDFIWGTEGICGSRIAAYRVVGRA